MEDTEKSLRITINDNKEALHLARVEFLRWKSEVERLEKVVIQAEQEYIEYLKEQLRKKE